METRDFVQPSGEQLRQNNVMAVVTDFQLNFSIPAIMIGFPDETSIWKCVYEKGW